MMIKGSHHLKLGIVPSVRARVIPSLKVREK